MISEEKLNSESEAQTPRTNAATPRFHQFSCVPATPSQLDPTVLCSANEALLSKIQEGILDTST